MWNFTFCTWTVLEASLHCYISKLLTFYHANYLWKLHWWHTQLPHTWDSRATTEIFINFVSYEQTFYHSVLLPRKSKNFPFLLSTRGQNCSGCRVGGPLCTSPVRPSHSRTVNSTLWTYRRIDLFTWNHYLCNACCYQHRNKTTYLYLQSKVKHALW